MARQGFDGKLGTYVRYPAGAVAEWTRHVRGLKRLRVVRVKKGGKSA